MVTETEAVIAREHLITRASELTSEAALRLSVETTTDQDIKQVRKLLKRARRTLKVASEIPVFTNGVPDSPADLLDLAVSQEVALETSVFPDLEPDGVDHETRTNGSGMQIDTTRVKDTTKRSQEKEEKPIGHLQRRIVLLALQPNSERNGFLVRNPTGAEAVRIIYADALKDVPDSIRGKKIASSSGSLINSLSGFKKRAQHALSQSGSSDQSLLDFADELRQIHPSYSDLSLDQLLKLILREAPFPVTTEIKQLEVDEAQSVEQMEPDADIIQEDDSQPSLATVIFPGSGDEQAISDQDLDESKSGRIKESKAEIISKPIVKNVRDAALNGLLPDADESGFRFQFPWSYDAMRTAHKEELDELSPVEAEKRLRSLSVAARQNMKRLGQRIDRYLADPSRRDPALLQLRDQLRSISPVYKEKDLKDFKLFLLRTAPFPKKPEPLAPEPEIVWKRRVLPPVISHPVSEPQEKRDYRHISRPPSVAEQIARSNGNSHPEKSELDSIPLPQLPKKFYLFERSELTAYGLLLVGRSRRNYKYANPSDALKKIYKDYQSYTDSLSERSRNGITIHTTIGLDAEFSSFVNEIRTFNPDEADPQNPNTETISNLLAWAEKQPIYEGYTPEELADVLERKTSAADVLHTYQERPRKNGKYAEESEPNIEHPPITPMGPAEKYLLANILTSLSPKERRRLNIEIESEIQLRIAQIVRGITDKFPEVGFAPTRNKSIGPLVTRLRRYFENPTEFMRRLGDEEEKTLISLLSSMGPIARTMFISRVTQNSKSF